MGSFILLVVVLVVALVCISFGSRLGGGGGGHRDRSIVYAELLSELAALSSWVGGYISGMEDHRSGLGISFIGGGWDRVAVGLEELVGGASNMRLAALLDRLEWLASEVDRMEEGLGRAFHYRVGSRLSIIIGMVHRLG